MATQNPTNQNNAPDPVFTRSEATDYLGVAVGTLEVWASTKRYALPYIRVGRRLVRYRKSDLDKFLQENLAESTAEHDIKKPD